MQSTRQRPTKVLGGSAVSLDSEITGAIYNVILVPGYSATPLWKKLGYQDKLAVYFEGAPSSYIASLDLPHDICVRWAKRPDKGVGFIHFFTASKSLLSKRLRDFRKLLGPDRIIWVSWPKKSSGVASDFTEDGVREVALPLGLVDIKVCAVDETWSVLKLVIRRELRKSGR